VFSYLNLNVIATEYDVLHQARVDELLMSSFSNELKAKNGITSYHFAPVLAHNF